jgi:prevent-host-death family protein
MKMINMHQAKTHLSRLIELARKGEEIVIGKAGHPLVKLTPFDLPTERRVLGLWKGKVKISKDFDKTPPWLTRAFEGR